MGINEMTQFLFHSKYTHMHFILTRRVEILHKSNLTVFTSLLNTYTFYEI